MLPGLIGSLTGGAVLDFIGGERANSSNRTIARDATNANMQDAQRNREFQERMSSSARQRDMEDLKKAGLNPLLAATGNGSSTPSGSTGSAQTATMTNTLGSAVASAREAQSLALAAKKQGAELSLMEKQGKATDAQAKKSQMETAVLSKGLPEADIKNSVYNWLKDKFSDADSSSAKDSWSPELKNFHEKHNPNYKKQQDKHRRQNINQYEMYIP